MPWDDVGYARPASDDNDITDAQVRELRRLCEKKDGQASGTYADMSWNMTRMEAIRRIDNLRKKVGEIQ